MKSWQEELLNVSEGAQCEREIFSRIEVAAMKLGFEHVAYGFRAPLPLSNPKTVLLNNYPQAWSDRYKQAGYLHTDPTVAHGRKSQVPVVWSDQLFGNCKAMWHEAQSVGVPA